MEWIQAAFDASDESVESNERNSAGDVTEVFDEKKFKENTELLKFGREHLQRIKNIKINTNNKKNNNIKNNPTLVNHDIFTLHTQRLIKKDNLNLDLKQEEVVNQEEVQEENVEVQEDNIERLDESTRQVELDNSLDKNIILQVPKGKEWKGYENCTAHIYGENIVGDPQHNRSNLGPLKEDLKSIHFNLPVQTFTTSDGQILQSNQIRRTQKRKHQINWLAMEAQEHEFELLQQTSHMRKTKRETQMKYGW